MKRFIDYIGSRKFAVLLLTATLLVILLSNLLPNLSFMRSAEVEAMKREKPFLYLMAASFRLGVIVQSPLFLIFPTFIFASITVCTIKRVKAGMRRESDLSGPFRYSSDFSGSQGDVEGFLRDKGWAVKSSEGVVRGIMGSRGFWGSIVFHLGMLFALLGFFLSLSLGFHRTLVLTEGYAMDLPEGFSGERLQDFPIKEAIMEGFKATYIEQFPVDYSMDLTFSTDQEEKARVKVNEPASVKGYRFVPMRYGFSPRFVMKRGGEDILDGYVTLVVMTPSQIDTFDVPGEGIKVSAQFFPDFYKEGLTPRTRSREPKNPVFFVEVKRGKEMLGRGFLPINKEVFFAGYTLEFRDLKMWAMFDVSRDPGIPPITFGFILIVIGLIIRLLWNEKAVWLSIGEGKIEVGGKARYFPALFDDELKTLAEGLRRTQEA